MNKHPLSSYSPSEMAERISGILTHIRRNAPVIHCITNYVSMDIMANVLLSLGASPAMVHAEEEVEEFLRLSSALVINIGTLSPPWVRGMERAIQEAILLGKPWVLDPVGCGSTTYRTTVSQNFAQKKPSLIRGNASEILALQDAQICSTSKGIDSFHGTHEAEGVSHTLARCLNTVIAISGATDFVTNGTHSVGSAYGHPLMTKVTALGCSLNAVMATFLTACSDPVEAAYLAFVTYGIAGQKAALLASGPGTFATHFLDKLYHLSREDIRNALEKTS